MNLKSLNRFLVARFKYVIFDKNIIKIKKIIKNNKLNKDIYGLYPPNKFKQSIVKMYAKRFQIDILIETGTYKGDMVIATKKLFKKIYSIEIDKHLYNLAKKRCSKYKHIFLYHGDSINILPQILFNIKQPCLFWLDAHYSGGITSKGELETPIMKELEIILNSSQINHVILIDDARFFIGKHDYPTIETVKNFIRNKDNDWICINKEDCIRIYKKLLY